MPAMALWAWLVCGLLASQAQGWRFGVSLSLSGVWEPDHARSVIDEAQCEHCHIANFTLEFWAQASKRLTNLGDVTFDIRNDESNRSLMVKHYTEMAQDPTIHALLGPGFISWNDDAAEIAETHGKVMLLWSIDLQVYQTTPFTVKGRPWTVDPSLQAALNRELQLQPQLSPPAPPPMVTDSSVGSFAFELNPSLPNWTISAIDSIGAQNHHFMFVWYADYPGNLIFEAQCVAGARHVYAQGGQASYFPMHVYSQLSRELGVLVSGNPDVVVLCGPEGVFRNLIKHLQVQNLLPSLMLVGWPLTEKIFNDTRATWLTDTLEPMAVPAPDFQRPDPVFRSYLNFFTDWLSAQPYYPRYEVIQVCGALSLLHAALSVLGTGGFSSDALARQIRGSSTNTVLGLLEFEADGRRKHNPDSLMGTRQLLSLSRDEGYTIFERFTRNSHMIISSITVDSCRSEACKEWARTSIVRPNYSSWSMKTLPTYPCQSGCLRGGATCVPCPVDTYRTEFDPICKPCPPGLFASTPGTNQCVGCPQGADCAVGKPPLPQYGYCRVQPWNGSCGGAYPKYQEVREPLFAGVDAARCVELLDTDPVFEWCVPARICPGGDTPCEGSNQGLLCGQCPRGQTYHSILPGRRRCTECPSNWAIVALLIWTALIWLIFVWLFSRFAVKSAKAAEFVPTSMMRALMHYIHMMSVVCEHTHLDARVEIAVLMLAGDHVYRPQEMAPTQCWTSEDHWPMSEMTISKYLKQVDVVFAVMTPPLGLCGLILLHGGAAFGWFAWSRLRSPIMRAAAFAGDRLNNLSVRLARIKPKDVAKNVANLEISPELMLESVNQLVDSTLDTSRAAAESIVEQGTNINIRSLGNTLVSTAQGVDEVGAPIHARERESAETIRLPESDSEGEEVKPDHKLEGHKLQDRAGMTGTTSELTGGRGGASISPEDLLGPKITVTSDLSGGGRGVRASSPEDRLGMSAATSDLSGRRSAASPPKAAGEERAESSTQPLKFEEIDTGEASEVPASVPASLLEADQKEQEQQLEGGKSFDLVRSSRGSKDPRKKARQSAFVLEDAYHRNVNFKPYDWASITFNQQHARRNLRKRVQDIIREIMIWNLMTYPMFIRSIVRLGVCREVTTGPGKREARWIGDLEVPCDPQTQRLLINIAVILAIGLPFLSMVFLSIELTDLLSLSGRRVTSIFTSGYKPDAYYWEVISLLRTGALVMTAYIDLLTLRCAAMFAIVVGALLLDFFMMPFEATARFALEKFSLYSQVGVLMIIVLGVIIQEERDANLGGAILESETLVQLIEVFVICYNLGVVLFAYLSAFVFPAARDLETVRENGGTVSWSLDKLLNLVRKTHGINRILYYQDSGTGEYIIDASELNWHERKFFVHCMTELISACIDSSPELHTWLVRRAIHEAFLRAWTGRLAKQKHLYQAWGLRTHSVFSLSCFQTQLRNPDIVLDANVQSDDDLLRLTVEELYVALSDVNYDIMEHHAPLRKEPESDRLLNTDFRQVHTSTFGVTRWLPTEGLNTLLEELKVTGKLKRRHRRKSQHAPDSDSSSDAEDAEGDRSLLMSNIPVRNPVLEEMEREADSHRAELDTNVEKTVGEAELIQELADLEEQIDEMAELLGEVRESAMEQQRTRRHSVAGSDDFDGLNAQRENSSTSSFEHLATPSLPVTPAAPVTPGPLQAGAPDPASRRQGADALPTLPEGTLAVS